MSSIRPLSLLVFAAGALALPSGAAALPTPSHVPAPHCQPGAVPVRGTVVDDGHTRRSGAGHTEHGQGFGYGHSCGGDSDGGGDDGGVSLN
ncbi:MAG: hypothetical protein Q7T55_09345 [Solirubrobacteraceae bacterium]|nr:hypothetical protein [Solirubrobacteraceae bacterium]